MEKYLDTTNGYILWKVFSHQDLLISFLNALLHFKYDEEITELEYKRLNNIPITPLCKFTIFYLKCKRRNQQQFTIEIVSHWTDEIETIFQFDKNNVYVRQYDNDCEDYNNLKPIYSLNLLFNNFFDGDEYFHQFQLAEKGNPDRIIEGIELVFVELKKFKPQTVAEHTMKRLWLRFLTEINEKTQEVPQELLDSPEICKAMSIVERGAYSDAQLEAYEKYWDTVAAEITLLNGHYRKDLREGEEIGIKKEKLDNARRMKEKGYPIEDIAEITGLSSSEIEKL